MIRVLVVEDDFRVARMHVEFAAQVGGFRVVGTAGTAAEAREVLAGQDVDLLLLDTYLPGESGLELLASVDVDAIMLTAASDAATVRTALARGALNYLVKPFTVEQLADRLAAYARYRLVLDAPDRRLGQDEIDRAVRLRHEGDRPALPKGRSPVTAELISDALRTSEAPRSAADIAAELGVSRATAQRYLAGLAQAGTARMTLRYGTTGRPEHLYHWTG
ncbi:MAG TPA: response regulator [Streptosporangiaceae bacterium]|jgi:two-component system CitB family response regulator